MENKKEPIEYKLIPLSEIDDNVKHIVLSAALGGDKQVIASDIINYTSNRLQVSTKQYKEEIDKLLNELETQKRIINEFKVWLQETIEKETGPSSKDTLLIVQKVFKTLTKLE
jgi:hypothetical protein